VAISARLHGLIDYWTQHQPRAEFARDERRTITYAEAADASRRLASAIGAAGAQSGDRLAVLADNSIEFVLLYVAASRLGCALLPLNTRLTPQDWAVQLAHGSPRILFRGDRFREIDDVIPATVKYRVTMDARDWRSLPAGSEPPRPGDDALYQMYTSGTTAAARGVRVSPHAVRANIHQIAAAIGAPLAGRSLVVAPLFHAAAVPSVFAPLASGGTVVIRPRFDPEEVVQTLHDERITFAVMVPTMLASCLQAGAGDRPFEHLDCIYYGASPIAETTLRLAMDAFGCGFAQSFGMTEATQAVTVLGPAAHREALRDGTDALRSAGPPVDDTQVAIGEAGEILVRGPQLMTGYWQDESATTHALRDGWLHTGDCGRIDNRGYVHVLDRMTDMIVSGGENVSPRLVEEQLLAHPAVAEVAVVGVPDAVWGEAVKAVVVRGAPVTEAELLTYARERVASFRRPRSVDFVDALPRNASGKLLRRLIREPYWAEQPRRVAGV
jgi:acyl-CoA synthetase (AMP-forming)/AMP-acid ligase II